MRYNLGETCFSANTLVRNQPVRGNRDYHIKNIMNPKDCQRECEKDDDCNYWTWFGPEIRGKQAKDLERKNTCWLKSGNRQMRSNCKWCHGKVSGPKTCKHLCSHLELFLQSKNVNNFVY